jgi:hypothetical protein
MLCLGVIVLLAQTALPVAAQSTAPLDPPDREAAQAPFSPDEATAYADAVVAPAAADAPAALSARHPDAGIWVMYRGANSVADLQKPYIKGVMAYARWNQTYTGPDQYDWSTLEGNLDFIVNDVGKRAMVDITAGYCPELDWPAWMRARVASRKQQNSMGCAPLQFWDPVYIELHKAYIRALADRLARFDSQDARPNETDIVYVRAEVMAETMENLPRETDLAHWEWQDFRPAGNGRIYKVDLTKELMYGYQQEITLAFQRELERAYREVGLTPAVAAAKGSTYWGPFPTRDKFVEEGVWFTQHYATPNPQSWYYDMFLKVKGGATRGTSETGGKSPENLLAQYAYWEVLAALHFGLEFIGIYGVNKFSPAVQPKGAVSYPENREALIFGERYAGHFRNPATSPGAWIALRGGYPEERYGGKVYFRRMWTNYEFLLRQIRPQDSVVLYGLDHTARPMDSLTPIVSRAQKQPWGDEIAGCLKSFSGADCDYLVQQPTKYLGTVKGEAQYTYDRSDLGAVIFCGPEMFCTEAGAKTRSETMLWARRTNGAGGAPTMRFDLADAFAQSLTGAVRVRIVYLDKGTGKWELRYDSQDNPDKSALIVQKQNSNQWKEVVVDLPDGAFRNRQADSADLSLDNMGDDDDIFHMIEVTRADGAQVPETPLPPEGQRPPAEAEKPGLDEERAPHNLYLPGLVR